MSQTQTTVSNTSPYLRDLGASAVASAKTEEQALFEEFSRLLDKIAVQLERLEGSTDFEIAVETVAKKVEQVREKHLTSGDDESSLPKDIHDLARQLVKAIPKDEESELGSEYEVLRKIVQAVESDGSESELDEKEVIEEIIEVINEDLDSTTSEETVLVAEPSAEVLSEQGTQAIQTTDAGKSSEVKSELEFFEGAPRNAESKHASDSEKNLAQQVVIEQASAEHQPSDKVDTEVLKTDIAKLILGQKHPEAKDNSGDKEAVLARFLESMLNSTNSAQSFADLRNSQVTKDSVVASIMMRQILGASATSLVDNGNSGTTGAHFQNAQVIPATRSENSSSRGAANSKAETLTRSQENKTLERVQSALKEVAKSKDGSSISVRLDPPNLGTVRIDLSLREGALYARLVAESPQVNNLLREKSQELQRTLRMLGLHVDQVNVSIGGSASEFSSSSGFSEQSNRGSRGSMDQEVGVGMGAALSEGEPQKTVSIQPDDHWVA